MGIELALPALHAVLAWEIGLLGHAQVTASNKQEALAGAYMRDPIFRHEFEKHWGKTSLKELQKLVAQLQSADSGLELLRLCYGASDA